MTEGEERKTQGQALALSNVPLWSQRARLMITLLAHTGRAFTSEDLVRLIGLPRASEGSNRNNAVGAAFSAAARRGVIRRVGYRKCSTPRNHAAIIAVWIDARCEGATTEDERAS